MSGEQPEKPEPNSYAETSAFTRLLSTPSRVKILDVFLGKHYTELTVQEIAHLAGVDDTTVHRNIEDIVEFGVIEKAGKDGKAQRYRLNTSSRIARTLGESRDVLMEESHRIPRQDRLGFNTRLPQSIDIQLGLKGWSLEEKPELEPDGPKASDLVEVEPVASQHRIVAGD